MTDSFDTFIEEYRLALEANARLQAELHRLQEMRKPVFGAVFSSLEGAVAARENAAYANERYIAHIDVLAEAEEAANLAQAKVKWMDVRFEGWRTRSASKRAELASLR